MKGPRWKRIVDANRKDLDKYLETHISEDTINILKYELSSTISYVPAFNLYDISIEPRGTFHNSFSFEGDKIQIDCADVDADIGGRVWYVQDRSSGAEEYKLIHQKHEKKLWTHRHTVGPFVAVIGGYCYAIEATKPLWFNRFFRVSKHTGKDYEVLLELEDPQWNLELIKGQHGCLFLLGNNAGQQKLWGLDENGKLVSLTGDFESFVPVGWTPQKKEFCFFGRRRGSQTFEPVGMALQSFHFPSLSSYVPQHVSLKENILVARRFGKRSLWNCSSSPAKLIDEIIGDYEVNPYAYWNSGQTDFIVVRPGFDRVLLSEKDKYCSYARSLYKTTKSADGTLVPYILVSSCLPKALLCVGYGAYGLPTHLETGRWKPLLKRGWGLAICMVRGGGDHNDRWAEDARRDQKIKSIEDFESCIRSAQKAFGLSPKQTAVYGRSAGGYLVGAALARHASGDLFQGVYAEVPYVDVFSTTANPSLPLTKLEYEEFGNPLEKIANAKALISLSPVHALPATGAPRVFVLCRTAVHDMEVFAYESVKWITALQEFQEKKSWAAPKLLAIGDGEGHFPMGESALNQRATDLAVLLDWASADKKSKPRIYKKMMNTRKNRKNNASRKNRKNNNATMGGKRKRRSSTRKTRKGRKGSRK